MADSFDLSQYNEEEYKIVRASNAEELAFGLHFSRPEIAGNKKIVCICDGVDFVEAERILRDFEEADAHMNRVPYKEHATDLSKLSFERFDCHNCDFRGSSQLNPIYSDVKNLSIDASCNSDELENFKSKIQGKDNRLLDEYNAEVKVSFMRDSHYPYFSHHDGAVVSIVDKQTGVSLFEGNGFSLDNANKEDVMLETMKQGMYGLSSAGNTDEKILFGNDMKLESWEQKSANLSHATDLYMQKQLRLAYGIESQRMDSGQIPKHYSFSNKEEALIFLEATKKEAEKASQIDLGGKKEYWDGYAKQIDMQLGKLKNPFYGLRECEVVINSDNFPVKHFIQDYEETKANFRMQNYNHEQSNMEKQRDALQLKLQEHDVNFFGLNRFIDRKGHKQLEEEFIKADVSISQIENSKRNLQNRSSSAIFDDFKKTIQNSTYCRCNVIDSISIWRMWKQYLRLNLNFISDSRDIIFIRAGCKY